MRNIIILVIVLSVGGLFAWRLWDRLGGDTNDGAKGGGRGGRKAAAVAVETAPLIRGEIRDQRVFTGTLQPRARFVFAPKIGGRLEALPVNIGDVVRPGQLIARIDDEEYVQQVNQARAVLDVARAAVEQEATELALAQREMERGKALREKKIASEAEWDQAEAKYKAQLAQLRVVQAQLTEKESALKAAEVRLAYTRIVAPEDPSAGQWYVEERYVDVGAMLAANTALVSVVDLNCLTAVVQVIERDYPAIAEGLAVQVSTDAFPGKTFAGKVIRIAPVLREASRQARVEIEIPNSSQLLRPGMFIRARMEFACHTDALLVPRTALVKRENTPCVFLVDTAKNTARLVPVKPGIHDAHNVEILDPPIGGLVVTLGQHLLADGTKILQPKSETVSTGSVPDASKGKQRKAR